MSSRGWVRRSRGGLRLAGYAILLALGWPAQDLHSATAVPRCVVLNAQRGDAAGVSVEYARLWVQGSRFKAEFLRSRGSPHVTRVELFDARNPSLVWNYDPRLRRAIPTLGSLQAGIAAWAREHGDANARRDLGIPFNVPLGVAAAQRPLPTLGPLALADIEAPTWRRIGCGSWQGHPVDVMQAVVEQGLLTHRRPKTIEASPRQTLTVVVHREWKLVLKFEHRLDFPVGPGLPPQVRLYQVTSARLVRPSGREFDLPSDTLALIPRTFATARLPAGVTRGRLEEPFAATGIDHTQYRGDL